MDIHGDGVHNQPAGTTTDDTDLARCIAASLVETGQFNGADIARQFQARYDEDPFDEGLMTADAIAELIGPINRHIHQEI